MSGDPQFEGRVVPTAVRVLAYAAVSAFFLSALMGLTAAIRLGLPADWFVNLPFQRVRPLHTLFAFMGMILGIFALAAGVFRFRDWSLKLQTSLLIGFTALAAILVALGHFSGREYIAWPPYLMPFLMAPLVLLVIELWRVRPQAAERSPEAFWLLFTGVGLLLFGLAETQLYLLPAIGGDPVRDLTVQWHGLDAVFAGINVSLYGAAVFFLEPKAKPLRPLPLFSLAGFSMLFTFGHHHYVSPQPSFLKVLALIASLIAAISFVRHLQIYGKLLARNSEERPAHFFLLRSAEWWTVVAIGSGIVFAIPQLNLYIHGTYLVVMHAMGSMIGINVFIILAGGFAMVGYRENSAANIRLGARLVNYSLAGLWVVLAVPSLYRGFLRLEHDFPVIEEAMRPYLWSFPALGLVLLVGLFLVCFEFLGLCFEESSSAVSPARLQGANLDENVAGEGEKA